MSYLIATASSRAIEIVQRCRVSLRDLAWLPVIDALQPFNFAAQV
jgi:hypothetical protein